MSFESKKLKDIAIIRTGKLDSNAAIIGGKYPFFTCDPTTLRIDTWAYDTEAVLLAGNNASGNYTAKYYNGRFNAYQRTYIIESVDNKKCLVRFLCYAINQQLQLLKTMSSGSTTKFLTIRMLHELDIPYPDIETQCKIVDVLGAIDDLIETNKKQINLLEETAQRLYKEWFVDLHFPGYKDTPVLDGIPKGWQKVPLGKIIDHEIGGGWGEESPTETCACPAFVIRGTDLFGLTHGELSGLPYRYHAEKNINSRILSDGDIIFEVSGGSKTEGVARTALIRNTLLEAFDAPVMCASFCKLIRASQSSLSQYLYDTFQYLRKNGKTSEFDKHSASSIVNYRWKDFLIQQKILLPEHKILEQYNSIAENIYAAILNRSRQIEMAHQTRDRLLPKLMSGELEV